MSFFKPLIVFEIYLPGIGDILSDLGLSNLLLVSGDFGGSLGSRLAKDDSTCC